MTHHPKLLAAALVAAAIPLGCGTPEGQLPTHRTEGTVLLRGAPAEGAYVVFHPQFAFDELTDPPRGLVGDDGSFRLSTYGDGDGAPAGQYKVAILAPADLEEGISLRAGDRSGPDPAFEKYAKPGTSGLVVTIEEGRNQLPPFRME